MNRGGVSAPPHHNGFEMAKAKQRKSRVREAAEAVYACIRDKGLDTQVGQKPVRELAEALGVQHQVNDG